MIATGIDMIEKIASNFLCLIMLHIKIPKIPEAPFPDVHAGITFLSKKV